MATRRLPVVAIVFLTFGIASPLLARYLPEIVKSPRRPGFQIQVPEPTASDAWTSS